MTDQISGILIMINFFFIRTDLIDLPFLPCRALGHIRPKGGCRCLSVRLNRTEFFDSFK